MILIMSSFLSSVWSYQTRKGIWIIVCFGLMLIYTILFPMLLDLSSSDFNNTNRFWWLLSPIIICFTLTVILTPIGYWAFSKNEIES
jgi:hypothetical protein